MPEHSANVSRDEGQISDPPKVHPERNRAGFPGKWGFSATQLSLMITSEHVNWISPARPLTKSKLHRPDMVHADGPPIHIDNSQPIFPIGRRIDPDHFHGY